MSEQNVAGRKYSTQDGGSDEMLRGGGTFSPNPRGAYRWKLRTRRGAVALPTPPCHPPRDGGGLSLPRRATSRAVLIQYC